MTQHFQTRAATDADAVQLCTFLNACTLAHQGIARFSPDDVVARLHQADADPQLDSFVVSDADEIVGFANVWRDGDDEIKFFARTHPDAQGRGVGSLLVALCDRAGRRAAPGRAMDDHDLGGRPRRAAAPARSRLPGRPPLPADGDREPTPSGTTSRRGRRRRMRSALRASRPRRPLCTTPGWRHSRASGAATTATEEAFWRERRDDKDESAFPFDPTLWLLACDGGEVIGFCLCELSTAEAARSAGSPRSAPSRRVAAAASARRSCTAASASSGGAAPAGSSSTSMPRT